MSFFFLLLTACNDFEQLSNSGFGAFEPSIALQDNTAIVVWHDNRHGKDEIYLRRIADGLNPLGNEVRLTENNYSSFEADVVTIDGDIVIAWYEKSEDQKLSVKLGKWSPALEPLWIKTLSSPNSNGRVPVLHTVNDKVFIAWIEETYTQQNHDPGKLVQPLPSSIYATWLDNYNDTLTTPYKISNASRTTWNLNADTMDNGNIALVFDAEYETESSELYMANVSANSTTVIQLTANDQLASKYPDIAINEDLAVLTWFDEKDGNNEIYLNFFNTDIINKGSDVRPLDYTSRRITSTDGDSIGAYVAWNDGRVGLAWNDNEEGRHEIYFQSFDASGTTLSSALRLTHSTENSLIPAIQPWKEGFLLSWNEVILGEHSGGSGSSRSEIVVQSIE